MRARRQDYGEHDFHLPSERIENDASSSSSSSSSCRASLSVVVLFILLGASLLAFEEEVSALFFVKDIKRGIQRVHARVLAPRKAAVGGGGGGGDRGSPLAPNPVRVNVSLLKALMDDGDRVVKGTVPRGWGRADAEYNTSEPKIAEDTTLGTQNDVLAFTAESLKGAHDAVEKRGATEFLSWRQVEPDCKVGDAEAMHTANQIRNATLEFDPYPHLQVYNIFPDRLYACIMRKIPPGDEAYTRLKDGVDRFMVNLYDRKRAAKGKSDKAWDALNGKGGAVKKLKRRPFTIITASTRDRLWRSDKFAPTLNIRHENYESIKSSIHSKMELNRDRAGYEIGPHTDSQGKWVTTLYYLAKDLVWIVHTVDVFPRYPPPPREEGEEEGGGGEIEKGGQILGEGNCGGTVR